MRRITTNTITARSFRTSEVSTVTVLDVARRGVKLAYQLAKRLAKRAEMAIGTGITGTDARHLRVRLLDPRHLVRLNALNQLGLNSANLNSRWLADSAFTAAARPNGESRRFTRIGAMCRGMAYCPPGYRLSTPSIG